MVGEMPVERPAQLNFVCFTRIGGTPRLRIHATKVGPEEKFPSSRLWHPARALGPFSAWLGVMVWVCESCCGAVFFGPWEGDVEVGEDESLDGGEPVEDESAAACVGGVQVGEGG